MDRYSFVILFGIVFLLAVGCSGTPGGSPASDYTGGGSGGGGGNGGGGGGSGDTVPGNISIGLAENPEAPRIPGGTSAERSVASDVNSFRNQNGLSSLIWRDDIADAERSHAYDCEQLGYFGHGAKHDPNNYNLCVQRGEFLGLGGYLWECGYGGGASGAMSAWANSSAHRAAILRSDLKYHGVGIGSSGAPTFWASLLNN